MDKKRFVCKLKEARGVVLLLLLIFLERIAVMCMLGADYNLANDDMGYIGSGIRLVTEGVVGIYSGEPSAMIMPGMTWLLALMTKVFGVETAYWVSVKLLWICMGTATAYVVYLAAVLLTERKWCGLVAAAAFLAPNIAWMDNVVLTETPYFLCLTLTVYLTLRMERTDSKRVFAGYCVAYMCGVLLRPTIVVMPVFSLAYLFLRKVDRKLLLRRMVTGIVILLLFLIPWTARNYHHFDTFVPLTYGSGNPMLLGTYQGFGYPADEELDYETNVEQVFRQEYAEYLDEEGEALDPVHSQYLTLEKDGVKADYRMSVWWETNPLSMLLSYLVIKPGVMLVKTFYWTQLFGVPSVVLDVLRALNFFLCCVTVLLAWKRKELRWELGFLAAVYWFYIYAISVTYSFSRYGETLMSMRYVIGAVGIYFLWDECQKRKKKTIR